MNASSAISLVSVLLAIVVHEYGHYLVAKKQGIYKGWGILPTPHVKLTRIFKSRWDYLSGFWTSLAVTPLYALSGQPIWHFPIALIGLALGDLIPFLLYHKLDKNEVFK